ncbi:MAG: P-loop NTPase fold protein [Myroides sp.]|uniref:P-loop NTPase fold protein n=1 Tax=Flavobacterium sp. TaxID=239 RepID=UPI002FC677D6
MNAIKIPNNSVIEDFKEHLDLDLNQRILFTAPFGAGKSTFINDFEEEHNKEYRFIRLYPVNYAVSANEDVFELIKFDILYELMAHHQAEINLQEKDFDFWLRMSMFMQNKADLMPLFLFVLSQHEKIGKSAAVFIGAFEKILKPLNKGFKEYSDQIKIDELADISTFLESFENKKGNQYEMDATSQFIYDLVDRLKGDELPNQEVVNDEDKKRENQTVLVIDDLDRLDPDHIFRLFNIFSAHTHPITEENKFGFDKVVFVCDIENIRKIYAHKYGKGVDFAGYMDKFYSLKPFEFDHKEHLSNEISKIIKGCHVVNVSQDCMTAGWFEPTLVATIKILLNYKLINLRSLKQLPSLKVKGDSKKGSDFEGMTVRGIVIFNILRDLFGSSSVLTEKINLLPNGDIVDKNKRGYYISSKFSLNNNEEDFFLGAFLPFLINDFARNDNYGDSQGTETIESLGITIDCVRSGNSCKGIFIRGNIQSTETGEIVKINLDRLLKRIYFEQVEKRNI